MLRLAALTLNSGNTVYMLALLFTTATCLASGGSLNTTVRATDCVSNSTHCHCSHSPAGAGSVCLKPVLNSPGLCEKGPCAAGFRCDCDSAEVCERAEVKSYSTTDTSDAQTVECVRRTVTAPRRVSGMTSDFHIVALQEFQLFINGREIGYGEAGQYTVVTSEIAKEDVIGLRVARLGKEAYGVKLRFTDVQEETRMIDENWYATDKFDEKWIEKEFDAEKNGWRKPSITKHAQGDGFDRDVPWMWFEDVDTVYMRYVLQ